MNLSTRRSLSWITTHPLFQQYWRMDAEGVRRSMNLVLAEAKGLFGIDSYLDTEDRRVLEDIILPYILSTEAYHTVLSVGCSWCTRGYNRRFEKTRSYWTMDKWSWKRRYGAKQHIVGDLQDLDKYFPAGTLDLILCNGVFGFGLNERADVERAFGACFSTLRPGGVLVVGWSDIKEERPFPLYECETLSAFVPFVFPPLGTAQFHLTSCQYVYSFYTKPYHSVGDPSTQG